MADEQSPLVAAAPAIDVRDLVVEFPGVRALDGVSFQLPAGCVTALVGPNGAGKSTLMRCVVALDRPLSGTIAVAGIDAQARPREVHRQVGFLSDNFGLYDDLSVERCLRYAALAHGLRGAALTERIAALDAQVGLGVLLGRRAGTLSRGERQRVGLAQALVHDPPILVLDEPASGLDPESRRHLSDLLGRLRDAGKAIVVSSHILSELEDYSDWMLTLDNGRVRGFVPVGAAPQGQLRWLRLRVDGDPAPACVSARAVPGVREATIEGQDVRIGWERPERDQADLVAGLVAAGVRVVALAESAARMQDVYLAQMESR